MVLSKERKNTSHQRQDANRLPNVPKHSCYSKNNGVESREDPRDYRAEKKDTRNRRKVKESEEQKGERPTEREECRRTMKEGEMRVRRENGSPSEIWFCISGVLPAEIMH